MSTNLAGLQAAIKLVADATNGEIKAFGAGGGLAAQGAVLSAVIPDVMALLPTIGDIPSEVSALAPADYNTLVTGLAADLNLASPKVEAIITAVLPILSSLLLQVPALIAALKM